jgi:hypothetical protein
MLDAPRGLLHAKWIDDGFFHPPSSGFVELVDADDLVHVPVPEITSSISFARVTVTPTGSDASFESLVVAPSAAADRARIRDFAAHRFPHASCTFLQSEGPGHAKALRESIELSAPAAAAVAITQYRLSWDEAAPFVVDDGNLHYEIFMKYAGETYLIEWRRRAL